MIRQKNLQRLVDTYETQQDFASLVGVSVQYISQLLSGHRNVGEKTARKFEKLAKLEIGYLDQMTPQPRSAYEPTIKDLLRYGQAPASIQQAIDKLLRYEEHLEDAERAAKVVDALIPNREP